LTFAQKVSVCIGCVFRDPSTVERRKRETLGVTSKQGHPGVTFRTLRHPWCIHAVFFLGARFDGLEGMIGSVLGLAG